MANGEDNRRGGAVGGWTGMQKGVPMVMVPTAPPDPVANATRTAGNILVIVLMLAAVLSAGFLFALRWLWSDRAVDLSADETPVRELVLYQSDLQEAVETLQIGQKLEKAPSVPPLQMEVARLEAEYATLYEATNLKPPPKAPPPGASKKRNTQAPRTTNLGPASLGPSSNP